MTDQGKANYEAYRQAVGGTSPVTGDRLPGYDDMPRNVRAGWDAGADAVELWLSQAPVDEDMPGNEPESAKVFVVIDDFGGQHRHKGSTSGVTTDGALAIGEREDGHATHIASTAVFAAGRWVRAYIDDDSALEDVDLRADLDRVKADAQVKLDAHRDEIGKLRKLLVRAVRELAAFGSPLQNALGAELARDGGIEP